MKIQHTTYEATHTDAQKRQASASAKVRNYISQRLSRGLDISPMNPTLENERAPKMWPSILNPAKEGPQNTVPKRKKKKEKPKFEDPMSSPTPSLIDLPLQEQKTRSPSRRKAKLTALVKDRLAPKAPTPAPESNAAEQPNKMLKIYNLRRAMQEGKLERVVPSTNDAFSGQGRRAPPRPAQNPWQESTGPAASIDLPGPRMGSDRVLSPTQSHSSGRRSERSEAKKKRRSSRLVDLIGSSADAMDETRRELQGKFEGLNKRYPAFGLVKKSGSVSSEDSFFCLGEEDEPVHDALRSKDSVRLAKGEGKVGEENTQPQTYTKHQRCKRCGIGWMIDSRGLCEECEGDISRAETGKKEAEPGKGESDYLDSECEDDYAESAEPSPKLKAWEPLRIVKRYAPVQKSPFEFECSSEDDGSVHTVGAGKKDSGIGLRFDPASPPIFSPNEEISQPLIDGIDKPETANEGRTIWNMTRITTLEYAESQKVMRRWSSCFGEKGLEEADLPMVEARDCDGLRRDSEFYIFWDEILKEHGLRSSGWRDSIGSSR